MKINFLSGIICLSLGLIPGQLRADIRVTLAAPAGGGNPDTTAIQAAFDSVAIAGGGVVVVPSGEYILSSTIYVSAGATDTRNVKLVGSGMGSSTIRFTGSGTAFSWFRPTRPSTVEIGDLSLVSQTNSGEGIRIEGVSDNGEHWYPTVTISNVKLSGFSTGLRFAGNCYNSKIVGVIFEGPVGAIQSGSMGMEFSVASMGTVLSECSFTRFEKGIKFSESPGSTRHEGVQAMNCSFTKVVNAIYAGSSVGWLHVANCTITTSSAAAIAIRAEHPECSIFCHNTIARDPGENVDSLVGIYLRDARACVLSENTIGGTQNGIVLSSSDTLGGHDDYRSMGNTVAGNQITGPITGIWLQGAPELPLVDNVDTSSTRFCVVGSNTIINPTNPIVDHGDSNMVLP